MTSDTAWPTDVAWKRLESPDATPTRGEFRVFDTGISSSNGNVLLAIDGSGLRHLLVPTSDAFEAAHDRRSGGVHLVTRLLLDGSGQHQYIDLACQKEHLNAAFGHMADEVLADLGKNTDDAFQTCRRTLQRWRELMDREVSPVMSTEAMCGLFGELWHVRAIAELDPSATHIWQGPRGARHDFSARGIALEVKTTLSHSHWRLRIHGLTQLEAPADASLFLCALRLELNGAAGSTLPELVGQILELGVDRHEFVTMLAAAGYQLRDQVHYEQFRFEVLDMRLHEVVDRFPRLTTADFGASGLPSGVTEIDYTVNLDATTPLKRTDLDGLLAALVANSRNPDVLAAKPSF
ncbi:PD-(D/E)XK motif protein [Paraburkholderia phenazinium]|uniref:Putative PD-(D/E)XK family member n=1 Tax=Paraburkholderia phenazinium TaxID=60549 RepID=A0A1N6I956_9BURK|nr:PD-(D/E)XK motif protein [Paraburkholderia phenazinium]SIO28557.1 Putative PD-(D/E)XK family member [Paraburkholderia phenazinium]